MLNKIVVGTANFSKPYGLLSNGTSLAQKTVVSILDLGLRNGIFTYDTAMAYGDVLKVMCSGADLKTLRIITKISVLDDYEKILNNIRTSQDKYNLNYHSILIHDPQNLRETDKRDLLNFFGKLKTDFSIEKIGVSIYDLKELELINEFFTPEMIQIPLNPLNQTFVNDDFLNYVNKNKIEVHARSLFLQGVLLANELPYALFPLKSAWDSLISATLFCDSRLQSLLAWAHSHHWVDKWVLGVACLSNFEEIIKTASEIKEIDLSDELKNFKGMTHPLIDPRNW